VEVSFYIFSQLGLRRTLVLQISMRRSSSAEENVSTGKKKTTKIRLQNTPIVSIGQLFLVNFQPSINNS
jgi:hypothetical protein